MSEVVNEKSEQNINYLALNIRSTGGFNSAVNELRERKHAGHFMQSKTKSRYTNVYKSNLFYSTAVKCEADWQRKTQ